MICPSTILLSCFVSAIVYVLDVCSTCPLIYLGGSFVDFSLVSYAFSLFLAELCTEMAENACDEGPKSIKNVEISQS